MKKNKNFVVFEKWINTYMEYRFVFTTIKDVIRDIKDVDKLNNIFENEPYYRRYNLLYKIIMSSNITFNKLRIHASMIEYIRQYNTMLKKGILISFDEYKKIIKQIENDEITEIQTIFGWKIKIEKCKSNQIKLNIKYNKDYDMDTGKFLTIGIVI